MAIETPCVKICVLDPVSGLCIGCGRTGAEIGGWLNLSPDQRKALIAELPGRMVEMRSRARRGRKNKDSAKEFSAKEAACSPDA